MSPTGKYHIIFKFGLFFDSILNIFSCLGRTLVLIRDLAQNMWRSRLKKLLWNLWLKRPKHIRFTPMPRMPPGNWMTWWLPCRISRFVFCYFYRILKIVNIYCSYCIIMMIFLRIFWKKNSKYLCVLLYNRFRWYMCLINSWKYII